MIINKKTLTSSFLFALEVIGIFIVIHFIRFIIGNLDAIYIGLSLILIAALLFIVAFLIARIKDNQNQGKPGTKTFTRLSGQRGSDSFIFTLFSTFDSP